MSNLTVIEVQCDDSIFEVEFTYEEGGYGNGYDEAPHGPEIYIQSIVDLNTGELTDDFFIETMAEEEAYDYINNL